LQTTRFLTTEGGAQSEHKPGTVYRCEVYLSREGAGMKAVAALPDVFASGNSESETLAVVVQLATEAVRRYKAAEQKVPWEIRPLAVNEVLRVVTLRP
jgi:hypothetical protein